MTTWRRFGRMMVCLAAVSALAACADDGNDAGGADDTGPTDFTDTTDASDAAAGGDGERAASAGDDADGPAVSTVTQPTVALPDCDVASEIDAPADWPYPVPDLLRLQVADVADRQTYRLEGVTNDADGLVIAAMDTMFSDLDVSEPTGDASSIELEFSNAASEATVALDDTDGDGCWNVAVAVTYVEPPDTDGPTPASVPSFEFDEATAVGRAQVITARGTFTLFVMRCSAAPVDVDAAGLDGALTITGSSGDFEVTWTYADGVIIEDDSPNVVGVDSAGGALFAEGDGPDGPESLVIEYFCE